MSFGDEKFRFNRTFDCPCVMATRVGLTIRGGPAANESQ